MKKRMIILVTVLLLASGNAVAFAGSYTDSYQSMPNMQQPTYSSSPRAPTPTTSTSEQSTTATPTPQNTTEITIQNFSFTPATIAVPMGTMVTWTNDDSTAHTVTGDTSGGPSSGTLQPGENYSFTFTNAGTFPYHCSIHPMMTAIVNVTRTGGSVAGSGTTSSTAPSNPSSTPTPSTPTVSRMMPATLPNTGAGNVLLVFGAAMVAGILGYTLYLLRKASVR